MKCRIGRRPRSVGLLFELTASLMAAAARECFDDDLRGLRSAGRAFGSRRRDRVRRVFRSV